MEERTTNVIRHHFRLKFQRWASLTSFAKRSFIIMGMMLQIFFTSNAFAQDPSREFSFELSNQRLSFGLEKLGELSGFRISYLTNDVARYNSITIKKQNCNIFEAVSQLLSSTSLTYMFKDNNIIVVEKAKAQSIEKQYVTVEGLVSDNNGPLPGVFISVKGTPVATVSENNGRFKIKMDKNDLLVFSYLGYNPKEVAVNSQTTLNVVMTPNTKQLDEVVVNGYFARKAESYTGSATTFRGVELMKAGNQNLLQSLKNLDPSFKIVDNLAAGSNPNATPTIQLRGQSGFANLKGDYLSNPNQPLFILDGFETTIEKINDMNMNIIESITLLKDASAKAVYGSKAANGVVVIETKRPLKGKMRVSYAGSVDISVADLSSYNLLNAPNKLEAEKAAGIYTSENVLKQIDLYKAYDNNLKEVNNGANTNWKSVPIRTGVGQKHSLNFTGGDDFTLYSANLYYQNIAGVMKGSNRTNVAGDVNLTYRYDKLQVKNNLSINNMESANSPYGLFSDYTQLNPYWRPYDINGKIIKSWVNAALGSTQTNPLWNSMNGTSDNRSYFDFSDNLALEWRLKPNLKLTSSFGINKRTTQSDMFKPANHTDYYGTTTTVNATTKGSYTKGLENYLMIDGRLGLDYTLQKGKHFAILNMRGEFSQMVDDSTTVRAQGFPSDKMNSIAFAAQYLGKPSGSEAISRNAGGFMALNYAYDERYLTDLTYRLNGSSEYGVNKRWGSFWSVGLGWNIHKEKFLSEQSLINLLKLRSSIGYTGSQGFSSYQALSTFNYNTSTTYGDNLGAYLLGLANPNLSWQKKMDYNAGFDLAMFDSKLSARFDYYVGNTTGLVTDVTVPSSMGFSSYKENLGETQNKGYQFNINYRAFASENGRNTVNVFFSLANNTNKVMKISNALQSYNSLQDAIKNSSTSTKTELITPSVRYEEGQSLNAIWAVKSLGIDPQNGKELFRKKDGTTTYVWNATDQVVCGDALPKFNGLFGANLQHSGFDLNLVFSYQTGGQIYNSTLVEKVENASIYSNVDSRFFTDRWKIAGDIAKYKAITDASMTLPTSRFVQDLTQIDISSINLSYDLNRFSFIKKANLSQLKATFYVNNLATFSTVKIERGTLYPYARTYSFSIQATF